MKILFEIWSCYTLNSIRREAGKYEVISDIGIFVVKLRRGWGPATAVSENLSLRGIVTNFVSGSQTLLTGLIRTIWTLNNIHSTDNFKYNTSRLGQDAVMKPQLGTTEMNIGKYYKILNSVLCVALHHIHTHDWRWGVASVPTSSQTLVITVGTIWFWNDNFPPEEKFQLPLEFENNKVNHDLRFFFNEPVWCSWTGLNFPSEESNNSDPSIVGASFVYWSDMTLIKVHCENWKEASTKGDCVEQSKWWLNIPAQVGVTIRQTDAGGTSSHLPLHACARDEDKELEVVMVSSVTGPAGGTCGPPDDKTELSHQSLQASEQNFPSYYITTSHDMFCVSTSSLLLSVVWRIDLNMNLDQREQCDMSVVREEWWRRG